MYSVTSTSDLLTHGWQDVLLRRPLTAAAESDKEIHDREPSRGRFDQATGLVSSCIRGQSSRRDPASELLVLCHDLLIQVSGAHDASTSHHSLRELIGPKEQSMDSQLDQTELEGRREGP